VLSKLLRPKNEISRRTPRPPSQNNALDAPLDGHHQNPNPKNLSACSHTTSFTTTMPSRVDD